MDEKDLLRLRPGQWLNDEIINFYGALLLGRSEGSKENVPNGPVMGEVVKGRGQPLNVHYFSTFFWTKLTGEGYDKGRLAKWTKKVRIHCHIIHFPIPRRSLFFFFLSASRLISFRKMLSSFLSTIIMLIGPLLLLTSAGKG